MTRRPPNAVVRAAVMDPDRRDLFVEGVHDKLILEHLCGGRPSSMRILVVDEHVELPNVQGGAKGRVLALAACAEQHGAHNLMFLVDTDLDRHLGNSYPPNVWQTDFPDMEALILGHDNFERVLRLAYVNPSLSSADFCRDVLSVARTIACVRLVSRKDNLNLKINDTEKRRYVAVKGSRFSFDEDAFLRTLLQKSQISLREFSRIQRRLSEERLALSSVDDSLLVRGKDCIEIGQLALRCYGVETDEFDRVLWASFNEGCLKRSRSIENLVNLLKQ